MLYYIAGSPGTEVTLTGTGFDPVPSNNMVAAGEVECTPTSVNPTRTELKCNMGAGPRGMEFFEVVVAGKGKAKSARALRFLFALTISTFEPTTVSLGGEQ